MTAGKKIYTVISSIVFAVVEALVLLKFFIAPNAALLVFALFYALAFVLARNARKMSASIFIAVVTAFMAFFLLPLPAAFSSEAKFMYPLQSQYIRSSKNINIEGYFPEKLPESAENFKTEFMPSILQGTGHYYVCFNADDEYISAAVRECSQKAVMSFKAAERDSAEIDEKVKKISGNENASPVVYLPEFVSGNNEVIYLLKSNYNFNHPSSMSVIINENENIICYSKLG